MLTRVPMLLRLEGAALLIAAISLFAVAEGSWWLFAALILAPDLAMFGYLRGPRFGAAAYNLAHLSALPMMLGVIGIILETDVWIHLALVWLAHVGFDRALAYGLKLPSGFHDTHLGRIGRGDGRGRFGS